MGNISVSLPSDGQTIDASDYNTPINTIVNEFNGNIDNDNIKANAAISGTKLADASVSGAKLGSPYAPQGYLQNGVISRTVANNDITVAIKTLAGADPSASDPVYVRIGGTVRSITSALSVTKNDGTDWFNSGSAEHATQDIDYFVYLGYNATDGVVIGFARIPYARVYSDFSATSTNDKYCAISNIATASASDEYEVVGRFNASLSATASFNWSIPATSIIISRPIFSTRKLSYTPTFANTTLGSGTVSGTYKIDGSRVIIYTAKFTLGAGSAMGSGPKVTTPMTQVATSATTLPGMIDLFDANVGHYLGRAEYINTTTIGVFAENVGGTYNVAVLPTSSVPFTWTTSDALDFTNVIFELV